LAENFFVKTSLFSTFLVLSQCAFAIPLRKNVVTYQNRKDVICKAFQSKFKNFRSILNPTSLGSSYRLHSPAFLSPTIASPLPSSSTAATSVPRFVLLDSQIIPLALNALIHKSLTKKGFEL